MGEYDTKRTKATPTAGPSEADRFGAGKVATDLRARVIKLDIEGGTPKITIASGTDHGARPNMTGYVRAGVDGVLAEFQIIEAKHGVSYAYLPDVTPEDLAGHLEVVINPSSRPTQPAANLTARVIHVEIIPLGTRITIPRGRAHGITVGTPGHLRTKEGRGAFVVSNSQLTRCQAIVHEPVDYVSANQEVILQRLPPKLRDGAVQRRAAGSTSADDVHATARAGVEGASSSLPFADIIQRAFGKHDISHVRTQVGGPATDASSALGARAYTTGNTIAFATAPDLHTAAHEAAHVVQQARGAVGFQGLGAADDEHERHADAVADAVVSGRSAESLLDAVAVGVPNFAIQRKGAAPPTLDAHATVALLVRDIEHRATGTRSVVPRARDLASAVTAAEITTLVREAMSVATLGEVRWSELRGAIRSMIVSVHRLYTDLSDAAMETRKELQDALFAFQRALPPDVRVGQAHGTVSAQPAPTEREHLALAKQALAAARTQARRALAVPQDSNGRTSMIAACTPIAPHLRVASDQAAKVEDRRKRLDLTEDGVALSQDLDDLASYLAMSPKLSWHRVFAATFDAENDVRAMLGLGPIARPYSGTLDPARAVALVQSGAAGKHAVFTTPESAVQGLAVAFRGTLEAQQQAVSTFKSAIQEVDGPRELTGLQKLLLFAVETAVTFAAGRIGSLVGAAVRQRLDSRALQLAGEAAGFPDLTRDISKDELKKLTESALIQGGALARAATADGVKDVAKELFKKAAKAGATALGATQPKSASLVSAFVELQSFALLHARTEALAQLASVSPALLQADLDVLQALYDALSSPAAQHAAHEVQYDELMRAWQNFKAQAVAPLQDAPGTMRDAKITDKQVVGSLEVYARASGNPANPQLTFRELKLHGAEPRAIEHFRRQDLELSETGLNQRFEIELLTDYLPETISFGVGPDRGVTAASFSRSSLRILKVYASKQRVTSSQANAALQGAYDHVPDAAAVRLARSWVYKLAHISTRRL